VIFVNCRLPVRLWNASGIDICFLIYLKKYLSLYIENKNIIKLENVSNSIVTQCTLYIDYIDDLV